MTDFTNPENFLGKQTPVEAPTIGAHMQIGRQIGPNVIEIIPLSAPEGQPAQVADKADGMGVVLQFKLLKPPETPSVSVETSKQLGFFTNLVKGDVSSDSPHNQEVQLSGVRGTSTVIEAADLQRTGNIELVTEALSSNDVLPQETGRDTTIERLTRPEAYQRVCRGDTLMRCRHTGDPEKLLTPSSSLVKKILVGMGIGLVDLFGRAMRVKYIERSDFYEVTKKSE